VLVGDYLFARAFQLMVETQNLRVLDILSNAAATIAEGEVLQLTTATNLATTEEIYVQVIRGKTAALFEAACEVGGLIAGQDEAVVHALARYGDGLGIAFQMADDLLDWGGASGVIGKNSGDDFRERKLTLPVIRAVARADAEERAFWVRTIEKGDQHDGDLEQAMEILRRHGTLEETRAEANRRAQNARAALSDVPRHDLTDMFADLAEYVVARLN
jgi:octaprenyl-diphosphate synthase